MIVQKGIEKNQYGKYHMNINLKCDMLMENSMLSNIPMDSPTESQ